jgi:hypothetical protein
MPVPESREVTLARPTADAGRRHAQERFHPRNRRLNRSNGPRDRAAIRTNADGVMKCGDSPPRGRLR